MILGNLRLGFHIIGEELVFLAAMRCFCPPLFRDTNQCSELKFCSKTKPKKFPEKRKPASFSPEKGCLWDDLAWFLGAKPYFEGAMLVLGILGSLVLRHTAVNPTCSQGWQVAKDLLPLGAMQRVIELAICQQNVSQSQTNIVVPKSIHSRIFQRTTMVQKKWHAISPKTVKNSQQLWKSKTCSAGFALGAQNCGNWHNQQTFYKMTVIEQRRRGQR